MVVPLGVGVTAARVAGQALCGAAINSTCEAGCDECLNILGTVQEEDKNTSPGRRPGATIDESNKAMESSSKLKPTTGLLRQDSATLFAKPTNLEPTETSEDNDHVEEENKIKTTIHHHKDGEESVFEVDYEGESTIAQREIISSRSEFYVDGNFYNGKIRDIETPAFCYNIKFNLDSSLLAIGLNGNGGVLLYETKSFSLVATIEREDSVSALDWVDNPFNENDDGSLKLHMERTQLLAVGGFDGAVSIYCISHESKTKETVKMLYDVRVKTDVLSMAFLRDNATNYAPFPLALIVGEKNGTVSMFLTDGDTNKFKGINKMRIIDSHDSAVLATAFGFVEDGIIMATGTKDGLVRVSALVLHEEEWKLSHLLFEHLRTGAIRALRFNHDSTALVVGGYDKTVLIVDTFLWKVVREIFVDGTVCSIEYDPYNRFMLLGTRSKILTIIDTSTHHPIKTIQTNGWVTSVTWGGDSTIAMRSDDKTVSLIHFEPVQSLGLILESSRGEECCLSWSYDGRFLSRTNKNEVIINDAKREFEEVSRLGQNQPVRGVQFCYAEGKRERLGVVGYDGFVRIFELRISVGKVHVEPLASIFLEQNLWSVGWSTDGECIMAGGKGELLHFICAKTYQPLCEPRRVNGRIKTIESISQVSHSELGDYCLSFGTAVTVGQNMAQIFDMSSFEPSMEITRKRTVRCLRYHPTLPILAIGDGSNEIVVVDLVGERRVASFTVEGRVNSIDFSPAGDFMAVGSDACTFTIHEVTTFKVLQEIPAKGFATSVAFSGTSGQYLAIGHADGETDIIQLGPLLSVDFVPLGPVIHEIPEWALDQSIYRSPEGPSFLQRCMYEGSKQSLMCAAKILKEAPSTVLTFDRSSGIGCFETAVQLRKPNIMQLILTTLVDGTLETKNGWSSSVMTTTMPIDGFLTLRDLILHHPPGFATDVLRTMTFIKVPFVAPIKVRSAELKECGSHHYTNPWIDQAARSSYSYFNTESKGQEILVPAVLPLPGLGTLDFLSALITHTGPDVFDNDAMGLVLVVMWNAGVRHYFLIDFIANIAFNIVWVFFVDRTSSNTASNYNSTFVGTILGWTVFTLNAIFLILQIIRIIGRQGQRFRTTWHVVDVVGIILVCIYTILVFISDVEDNSFFSISNSGKGNVTLAVLTTLVLTAKFVSLLRGFDRTGWLVAVLTQNFLDVRGFIIVIVCILFGFTIAFRLLFARVSGECVVELDESSNLTSNCDVDPFGSLGKSLLSTFELTILGSYESSFIYDSDGIILSAVVFVISVTVVLVIALNALIAVLGDSFSRVQENVTANRRRERAELIVEYLSMMPTSQRKKIELNNQYFHALLASDGHGDLLVHKDDWQGGLNALKRELTELTEANNEMTNQTINQLREELKEEISIMMRNEVGIVLNDIFMEVKEISKAQRSGQLPPSKKVFNAVQVMQKSYGIQKNFAPFDGIKKTLLKPLPLPSLPSRQRGEGDMNNQNGPLNNEQQEDHEIETTNNAEDDDEYPNLMASATFG